MKTTTITCIQCGLTREVRPDSAKRGQKYCSLKCANTLANNPGWNGGRTISHGGYVQIAGEKHGSLEHQAIAARALGRPLPPGAEVHHLDEDKTNNSHSSLVICESREYHLLLHKRQRVIAMGGDPGLDKICSTCQALKSKADFYNNRTAHDGLTADCKECCRSRMARKRSAAKLAPLRIVEL
jgi:hypothetical protein